MPARRASRCTGYERCEMPWTFQKNCEKRRDCSLQSLSIATRAARPNVNNFPIAYLNRIADVARFGMRKKERGAEAPLSGYPIRIGIRLTSRDRRHRHPCTNG